jgi:hypothetical protein
MRPYPDVVGPTIEYSIVLPLPLPLANWPIFCSNPNEGREHPLFRSVENAGRVGTAVSI